MSAEGLCSQNEALSVVAATQQERAHVCAVCSLLAVLTVVIHVDPNTICEKDAFQGPWQSKPIDCMHNISEFAERRKVS